MSNKKIVIKTEGEKLLLGNHMYTLNDESIIQFHTEDIQSFVKFLSKKKDFEIYYSESSITAMPKVLNRWGDDLAYCTIKQAPALTSLRNNINKSMDIDEFEEFLFAMRRYLRKDTVELLGKIRALVVKKVQKIEREKSQNGDFVFHMSSKSEKDSWIPPTQVHFEIPVVDSIDDTHQFSLDLFFNFSMTEDRCVLLFTIRSPEFQDELRKVRKIIIEKSIESIECEKYVGQEIMKSRDDSWKFQLNKLPT